MITLHTQQYLPWVCYILQNTYYVTLKNTHLNLKCMAINISILFFNHQEYYVHSKGWKVGSMWSSRQSTLVPNFEIRLLIMHQLPTRGSHYHHYNVYRKRINTYLSKVHYVTHLRHIFQINPPFLCAFLILAILSCFCHKENQRMFTKYTTV